MSDAAIRAEQIRTLYRQSPPLLIANVTNAVLVAAILWTPALRGALIVWVAATALVTVLRLALSRRFLAAAPSADRIGPWARRFVVGSGAAGLLWGVAAIAFFDPRSTISQVLITFVIAGNTAGAASAQFCYLPAFLAYFLGAIVPFAARLAAVGDPLRTGMTALLAAYGVVLVTIARGTHATLRETFRLRFENDALVQNLSKAATELEKNNAVLEDA